MTTTQGEHAQTEAQPIQRFEVVDCIDSKHVPAVIPRKDGPWVRYEDHAAQVAALTAQPAAPQGMAYATTPDGEPSNVELRGMWYGAGGTFHGPNVETGTMPESKLLPFLRSLASGGQAPAGAAFPPAGCGIHPLSSRACERGTKSCVVQHEPTPTAQAAPAADYDHGPQSVTVAEAARHVGKWLNERPNRPLDLRDVAMLVAHAQAPAAGAVAGPDGRMSDELRSLIEGMTVSVDVSTGDHDAGNRYFGTVTEVMDDISDKHGVTLLVQDAKPNFAPTPAAQADSQPELAVKPACWIPPEYEGEYHRPGESITAYREPIEGWEPVYREARKQGAKHD